MNSNSHTSIIIHSCVNPRSKASRIAKTVYHYRIVGEFGIHMVAHAIIVLPVLLDNSKFYRENLILL